MRLTIQTSEGERTYALPDHAADFTADDWYLYYMAQDEIHEVLGMFHDEAPKSLKPGEETTGDEANQDNPGFWLWLWNYLKSLINKRSRRL